MEVCWDIVARMRMCMCMCMHVYLYLFVYVSFCAALYVFVCCVQVWDRDEHGQWVVADGGEFKGHDNSILRVSWAHPEFGQVFATCSTDSTVRIWEEQEGAVGDGQKQSRWQSKAQLADSKRSVNDVQFAPRYHGLKLATASADGSVRIYEANDVFSLSYWPMQVSDDCPKVEGIIH